LPSSEHFNIPTLTLAYFAVLARESSGFRTASRKARKGRQPEKTSISRAGGSLLPARALSYCPVNASATGPFARSIRSRCAIRCLEPNCHSEHGPADPGTTDLTTRTGSTITCCTRTCGGQGEVVPGLQAEHLKADSGRAQRSMVRPKHAICTPRTPARPALVEFKAHIPANCGRAGGLKVLSASPGRWPA